ncbi:M15 family metallopeptidase [Pontibacterium sp.]
MEIADWSRVDPALCLTDADGLSASAHYHRQLLQDVMGRAGFVNYAEEWWHFSYGDQLWAYVTGNPVAIYGAVER